MPRHCYVTRVFTRGTDGGNHLGVVTDRSGLSDEVMQQIAADLGFSETIYLDWRDRDAPRVRIFTPTAELAFAGHPMVGVTWVLHALGPGGPDVIHCEAGPVGVRMEGDVAWIDVTLDQPVRLDVSDYPAGPYDPGAPVVRASTVDMPVPYLVLELASPAAVSAAPPAPDGMVYVFARGADRTITARFFAPSHGIAEDPATGSAAVAFIATEVASGRTSGEVTIRQGDEIGFPSTIQATWSDGTASLGGTVVRDEVRWLDE